MQQNKFSQCTSESTACETWCSACDHFRQCSTAQLRCELCKSVGISTSSPHYPQSNGVGFKLKTNTWRWRWTSITSTAPHGMSEMILWPRCEAAGEAHSWRQCEKMEHGLVMPNRRVYGRNRKFLLKTRELQEAGAQTRRVLKLKRKMWHRIRTVTVSQKTDASVSGDKSPVRTSSEGGSRNT